MYIHIGADVSIPAHWIVGIFDLDHTAPSGSTTEFLNRAERDQKLDALSRELPRSIVVTVDRVFLTPISSETLRHRLKDRYKA